MTRNTYYWRMRDKTGRLLACFEITASRNGLKKARKRIALETPESRQGRVRTLGKVN